MSPVKFLQAFVCCFLWTSAEASLAITTQDKKAETSAALLDRWEPPHSIKARQELELRRVQALLSSPKPKAKRQGSRSR